MRDFIKSAGAVAVVAVVGVGASLATVLAMRDAPAGARVPDTRVPGRVVANPDRRLSSTAVAPRHAVEASSDTTSAAYETALRYIDCETRAAEPPPNTNTPDEAYEVDATGKLAARLARAGAASDARCRQVGPAEYRQIESLLRSSAAQGNRDAQSLLLRRRANALVSEAQQSARDAQSHDALHVDPHEAHAVMDGLEQLALSGHRDSIVALQQLLSSSAIASVDPVEAAAWRLVSLQVPGAPLPEEAKLPGRVEVLDEMDDATREAVLARARALFARCCKG